MPKPLTLKPRINRQDFEAGFSRSKRGNLWRHWRGLSLTVFRRPGDGWYSFAIAGKAGPRFSRYPFETESEALEALFHQLNED